MLEKISVPSLAAVFLALTVQILLTSAEGQPLRLIGRTSLPDYDGDFDHFAADISGRRLFLAGEDRGTLEVFDLKTGKHLKTVGGLETPHAIHYMPDQNRLLVTNSGPGMSKLLDGKNYRVIDTVILAAGADAMGYDASTKRAWVVTGGKNALPAMDHTIVSEVDPSRGTKLGDVIFDTDFVEGIAAEQRGKRVFINLAGKHSVAVLDKTTRQVVANWPISEGQNPAPIALDETHKRLFVVTRNPFKLIVIDTDSGQSVASFEAPSRTNELIYDHSNRRLYLTGDDYVGVFQQNDADHYEEIARVPSENGAKTAFLVPGQNRLYVAVAGKGSTKAALLHYQVEPTTRK